MKKRNLLLVILAILLVFGLIVSCDDLGGEPGDNPSTGSTDTKVTLSSVTADGGDTARTTKLTLTFSEAIEGLTEDDITLTAAGITIDNGKLTAVGAVYTLPIEFSKSGTLNVAVAKKTGYAITIAATAKTVAVKDPFEVYYQLFDCTYDLSKQKTEKIDIKRTEINFYDNEKSKDTPNAIDDYLVFTVTKWEFITTALPNFTTAGYNEYYEFKKGIKITGKIKGAQPPGTETTGSVYGTTTCPNLLPKDIGANAVEVSINFYFTDEMEDTYTYLARSAFTGGTKTPATTPQNPLTGTTEKPQRRVYKNTAD